ncbi:MAG TPA: hypothetical protein VNY04_02680 [Chthoniobacterales bacterium]|nr:hypothetical protein [Chthoniobacterales bacterium]
MTFVYNVREWYLSPSRLLFPPGPQNAVHSQIDVVIVKPFSLAQ